MYRVITVFVIFLICIVDAVFKCDDIDCECFEKDKKKYIDCSERGLTGIPGFNRFIDTGSIDSILLNGNLISSISSYAFLRLRVRKIDISNNSLETVFSKSFDDLTGLEHLDLSENPSLRDIPLIIGGMESLRILNLHNTELSTLKDNDFKNLTNLEHLDLSHNSINIPLDSKAFIPLRKLKYLNMEECALSKIPNVVIRNTPLLERLLIKKNRILLLPPQLKTLVPKLVELDLSRNPISLPKKGDIFQGLNKLEILKLSDCELTNVTSITFRSLTKLTNLTISRCNVESFAGGIFTSFNKLKNLNIGGNQFNYSSDLLKGLENTLDTLNMRGLKIMRFPKELLRTMTKLKVIDLEENDITLLDQAQFETLHQHNTHIYLKDNKIASIDARVLEKAKTPVNLYIQSNNLSDLSFLYTNACQFDDMTVDVSGNNISCDCSTMKTIQQKVVNLIGECADPSIVAGKKLTYKPKNANPLQPERRQELTNEYFEFTKLPGCQVRDRTAYEYSCSCKTWNTVGRPKGCPYTSSSTATSWSAMVFLNVITISTSFFITIR